MNNIDWKKVGIAIGIVVGLILIVVAVLFFMNRNTSTTNTGGTFGTAPTAPQGTVTTGGTTATSGVPTFSSSGTAAQPMIFKIADGPVVAATLVESGQPTTTVARYLTGEDGHVLELPLDVPGAVPHIVSNTTIPGIERAVWTDNGNGLIVQYIDQGALASAHITLPFATTTSSLAAPVSINFLPGNVIDLAAAPASSRLAYLLPNAGGGADGYIGNTDGSNTKKVFSLPLSQLILAWPSPNTLLAYTKSASGIQGLAFSIVAKTGVVSPVLYGLGLTATADPAFSTILYRTDNGTNATLFNEKVSTGSTATVLLSSPLQAIVPETCAWGTVATTTVTFCAAPAAALPQDYLDLWHRGEASVSDTIVAMAPTVSNVAVPVATPGTSDGGENSDIIDLSISPDTKYLSFISKDDGALWGVRLR